MKKGLITKSTGSWYSLLEDATGQSFEARMRGKFKLTKTRLTNPLAVGDRVEFDIDQDDIGWITKIEPRRNYLIRKSVNLSKEAHIIAANIDVAVMVFTLKKPETSLGFLDRFLACCEAYSLQPLIVFHKSDLFEDQDWALLDYIKTIYQSEFLNYRLIPVSSLNGDNVEILRAELKDRVSLFFGHSGAGKSTLVNALQPGFNLKTGNISEVHQKGKHTTTFAQMLFWEFGGSVIDTPGVREFGMIDVQKEEIQHYFPEIFQVGRHCKYHNCLHLNEPKCAVQTALEEEDIAESRYATYLKLLEEAEEQNLH